MEVIWLLKGLTPGYRTIANFRAEADEVWLTLFAHLIL